jgi:hypothetical protein
VARLPILLFGEASAGHQAVSSSPMLFGGRSGPPARIGGSLGGGPPDSGPRPAAGPPGGPPAAPGPCLLRFCMNCMTSLACCGGILTVRPPSGPGFAARMSSRNWRKAAQPAWETLNLGWPAGAAAAPGRTGGTGGRAMGTRAPASAIGTGRERGKGKGIRPPCQSIPVKGQGATW